MLRERGVLDFTLRPQERAMLGRLLELLRERFAARFDRAVVFGSRARGDATADSDIDLLVLLRIPLAEEDDASDTVWELLGQARREAAPGAYIALSPVVLAVERFDALRASERRFALDVDAEGIAL